MTARFRAGMEYESSSDSEGTARNNIKSRPSFIRSPSATDSHSHFLMPSGRSSTSSTASSTPLPSRSNSPLPQLYPSNHSSSCPSESDSDTEPSSPLLLDRVNRDSWWREDRRTWWSSSTRRRRKKGGRIVRFLKRWLRRLVRHPFFPSQPTTIVLTLILFSIFAISLTLLLIYILNPDKEPLPWRAYCSIPSLAPPFDRPAPTTFPHIYPNITKGKTIPPFPPPDFDFLPPAGVFIGVFSIDSALERRMLVRTTWASHPRSRDGAGPGDDGAGTSRTIVRFILGQPRKDWERQVKLEMELYNDIVILPIPENMNSGKSHSFFSWAAFNAWVPPIYRVTGVPPPNFPYSNFTSTPPSLATHDPFLAWENINSGTSKPWVRPDYVVKVDDDSFIMLAELEARLRFELHAAKPKAADFHPTKPIMHNDTASTMSMFVPPPHLQASVESANNDPLIYWGYLVTNRLHQFMAGELYALSWSLVDWISKDATVKTLTRGAEDKQTAKWMRLHPRAPEIRWASERCWIYDHPRSGTVYSHGYIFPSEVTRVKRKMLAYLEKSTKAILNGGAAPAVTALGSLGGPTPSAWAHSSVSTFGVRYQPPLLDLSPAYSIEALVEGSDMSMIQEGSPVTPDYAWTHREGRKTRFEGKRIGGTVVVHFIKKNMWYLETALALLEGEEQSESEKYESARKESQPSYP
ncbi:hypothetical protein BYT27DRAFT_7189471 [Phlegmacium glaucopus]|nr:hypothetical protein BYT27DRAFT_7189471 [Phlegmacium glaucopus]